MHCGLASTMKQLRGRDEGKLEEGRMSEVRFCMACDPLFLSTPSARHLYVVLVVMEQWFDNARAVFCLRYD